MYQPHYAQCFYVRSVTMDGEPPRVKDLLLFRTSEDLMNFFPTQIFTREEFLESAKLGDTFMTRMKDGKPQKIELVHDPAGDRFVVKGKPNIPVLFDWDGDKHISNKGV